MQIGEEVKTVTDFIFLGSKCSYDIKRRLLLGRKAIKNLGPSIKQRRSADKGPAMKATVSPAVMYRCESWTTKAAECRKTDASTSWCWRHLRVPWTARGSHQSILKEYSLEGLMLKLKLQYFGHLMWRANSLEKTLILEKIEGRRRRGRHTAVHGVTKCQTRLENHPQAVLLLPRSTSLPLQSM